jgi:hypothetical protein
MIRTARGLHEDVSDLNGIALPAMYFDSILTEKRGSAVIMDMIQESVKEMKPNSHGFLKQRVQELPTEFSSPADYLYLANVYSAVQEKLYSKLRQIDREEYSWITPEMMARCSARLQEYIVEQENKDSCSLSNLLIEHSLIHFVQEEKHGMIEKALYPFFSYETRFRFSARADLITESTLWELKCTSKISQDHLMQLVIYAWIWLLTNPQLDTGATTTSFEKAFKIMNIRTGERLRLEATLDELTFIVVELLKGKYGGTESLDNEDFVQECVDHILETTS